MPEAGLVWGRELFFDATKVRANANANSLVPRLSRVVGDHLEALFPPVADPMARPGPPPAAEEATARGPAGEALPAAGPTDPAAAPRRGVSWTPAASIRPARPPAATAASATRG